jgi:alpha-D-ribose 1-methylphosphonate 5-triphosphate synthase subunit PhnI
VAYVAVRGGREAIDNAERFLGFQRDHGPTPPLEVAQVATRLHLAVDRVMGEGSLYAPGLAALALIQSAGDTFEAAFAIRAHRATLPRIATSLAAGTGAMRVIRRISSAFKEIPGGQILGPTPDYTLRLLDFSLIEEEPAVRAARLAAFVREAGSAAPAPATFPKMVDILRAENMLAGAPAAREEAPFDVTREALRFPAPRSAVLQTLARGETGGLLALAYSNMRGYGAVHPTIGELRVGFLPLKVPHPVTGRPESIGEVKVTEAEIISQTHAAGEAPRFHLGYGLCFGHNETKAISMAVLDRAIGQRGNSPSEDEEFVLSHVDGIEAMGFAGHFKLPHYVTFQSSLDRLRKMQERHAGA